MHKQTDIDMVSRLVDTDNRSGKVWIGRLCGKPVCWIIRKSRPKYDQVLLYGRITILTINWESLIETCGKREHVQSFVNEILPILEYVI